ncbi:hypothetical protein EJF18_60278 [Clavispora lusitaniae]|uniref:Uncharacterized protein n=1 Tax=Clavispora lusitaniae TaxID=36911 RepID=A0ACD0WR54_CLALS|nr:hypothetical protein EJF14_60278 [Clavispora lusitaniae]QFZ35415.1 hypothetical protein EJF16_60278 [Clavispora lusitaniae]QFZ41109.1 hypothetical protein EJF15_60278 [Clavispora lusitaniae]QFZ46790.1 hypothetical protein EJF18_60278 [Clavispora lusitaniae]QFZ52455.1 hypothetical protein EJF17_60278 [Clavispora lusitaniae]
MGQLSGSEPSSDDDKVGWCTLGNSLFHSSWRKTHSTTKDMRRMTSVIKKGLHFFVHSVKNRPEHWEGEIDPTTVTACNYTYFSSVDFSRARCHDEPGFVHALVENVHVAVADGNYFVLAYAVAQIVTLNQASAEITEKGRRGSVVVSPLAHVDVHYSRTVMGASSRGQQRFPAHALLSMLQQFSSHDVGNFLQLALASRLVCPSDHGVDVARVRMEEHGRAQVRNSACPKSSIPSAHEAVGDRVQHQYLMRLELRRQLVSALAVFHLAAIASPEPVEPSVLVIGENSSRRVFAEPSCHCKATSASTNNNDLEEVIGKNIGNGRHTAVYFPPQQLLYFPITTSVAAAIAVPKHWICAITTAVLECRSRRRRHLRRSCLIGKSSTPSTQRLRKKIFV